MYGWMKGFFGGKNHQVMKAHGKFSVISGTVSLADLWSFLILSEIQDRYMIHVSQRCIQILWCCSYLVNYVLFPCCPIFFSLTTACAKSGYLVDLLNYLSFHEHPVNYTRGTYFGRKKVCASWRFESWLGLYRIDLSCPSCVAGVARSIITPF